VAAWRPGGIRGTRGNTKNAWRLGATGGRQGVKSSLLMYGIDKKSRNTAIKGSKAVIEKPSDVQMDY